MTNPPTFTLSRPASKLTNPCFTFGKATRVLLGSSLIFSDFSLPELYDLLLEKYNDNKSEKKLESNDSKELERNYGKIEKMIDTSKNGTNELASFFENFFDFLKDDKFLASKITF